jgi:hypothetical protein
VLRDHERLLYRGAVSFEAFIQTLNDKNKWQQADSADQKLFRQLYYRYAIVRVLGDAHSLCVSPGIVPPGQSRVDMAIYAHHSTQDERRRIEDRLADAAHSMSKFSLKLAVKTHGAECRSLRPDICRTVAIGDGNNKLFEAVCPVIPPVNPRYLHVAAGMAPLALPCGRYPANGCSCDVHVADAPPRPINRKKRVLPRPKDAGKKDRVYCQSNRNDPAPGDVKRYISAGVLSFGYPCGHMAALVPMFWHESFLQVFAVLRDFKEEAPELSRIGYDNMCHFAP